MIHSADLIDRIVPLISNKRIFITGASGFFGSNFITKISELNKKFSLNISVVALTRSIEAVRKNTPHLYSFRGISWIEGDIENFEFPEGDFDQILHMATATSKETFEGVDQLLKFKSLINGTERVLNFAAHCKAKKILFTSSGVVYGDASENCLKISENYLGAPSTSEIGAAVGHGKRIAEYLCAYYSEKFKFDYVIARCFSFSGRGIPLDLHYALGNFIADAVAGRDILIQGDGQPIRGYLDVDDLTLWLLCLLSFKNNHKIYNVGSDQAISISNLAKLVASIVNPDIKVNIKGQSGVAVGSFNRNIYVPNIDRIVSEYGIFPWTSLSQSICNTVDCLDT
jgi:dTDP-glucose 4,6-dehydratase/UDP-glucose 4-epimerase